MTQPSRSTLDMLDDRANLGLYVATLGACLASALMLFAPGEHADGFLAVAWGCMGVSALCLAGKLWIGLVASRDQMDSAGRADA